MGEGVDGYVGRRRQLAAKPVGGEAKNNGLPLFAEGWSIRKCMAC